MIAIDYVHPWLRTVIQVARVEPPPDRRASPPPIRREALDPLGRRQAVIALLPVGSPPCFPSRQSWEDYMQEAAATMRTDNPLRWVAGSPAMNRQFSYCEDCTAERKARMVAADRCVPGFLRGESES